MIGTSLAEVEAKLLPTGPDSRFTDRDFEGTERQFGAKLSKNSPKMTRIVDLNKSIETKIDAFGLPKTGASTDDVQQGQLGDCYLMSALATLTERPALLRALIPVCNPHKSFYGVRLFFNGEFRIVIVDDFFPTVYGRCMFAHGCESASSNSGLWVLLCEKAYAKIHGTYDAIEGGFESQAMSDLTGGITILY